MPCYNEEQNIPLLYAALRQQLPALNALGAEAEVIFVDDGSKDGTCAAAEALTESGEAVRLIRLSRNFGKEAALASAAAAFCLFPSVFDQLFCGVYTGEPSAHHLSG